MGTKPGSKKNTDTDKTALKPRNPLHTIGVAGAVLAILALPVGGYALYVVNQLKEVEAQNLRTLAQVAGTLEALVANFQTNVENLTKFLTGAVASVAALITLANKISGWRHADSGT